MNPDDRQNAEDKMINDQDASAFAVDQPQPALRPYPANYQPGNGSILPNPPLITCERCGNRQRSSLDNPVCEACGARIEVPPRPLTVYAGPPLPAYAGPPLPVYAGPPVPKPPKESEEKSFFRKLFHKKKS